VAGGRAHRAAQRAQHDRRLGQPGRPAADDVDVDPALGGQLRPGGHEFLVDP
jgi:hypothetical protein